MRNVTVEVCKNRTDAEKRKKAIKELDPNADWKTRIVTNVASLGVLLMPDANTGNGSVAAEVLPEDINAQSMALLMIWAEPAGD